MKVKWADCFLREQEVLLGYEGLDKIWVGQRFFASEIIWSFMFMHIFICLSMERRSIIEKVIKLLKSGINVKKINKQNSRYVYFLGLT